MAVCNSITSKCCAKCSEIKIKSEFNKAKSTLDGLQVKCRACDRAYYIANKDKIIAYQKASSIKNAEKIKAAKKIYAEKNKKKLAQYISEWSQKNKESLKKYYALYKKNNYEIVANGKRAYRARRRKAEGSHTTEEVSILKIKQKNKCACCHLNLEDFDVDHISPLSKGGSDYISNIQLLCPRCNRQKNARDPIEFMQSKGYLL